jgi:hypothetical protein
MNLILQSKTVNFWAQPYGSSTLWTYLFGALIFGILIFVGLMYMPAQFRRPVVAFCTFIAGAYWVLLYAWPAPIDLQPNELPQGPVEGVGAWLKDANPVVVGMTGIITAFMLGLGIFSLLSIHLRKIRRQQRDWPFSVVLLVSMVAMVSFGYADYFSRQGPDGTKLDLQANWGLANYGRDLLFDGLLQQMDAAMFSVIAFYILSAAYRAFRIRSVEATILLSTALLVMLSLMGAVAYISEQTINGLVSSTGNDFFLNFTLTEVAGWVRRTFETSSLRGIAFGVGIGALAMGLRIWLSLEKSGGNA